MNIDEQRNGGVLNPFGFESSTLTIVVQQIIALKTTKSKFYVATPYAGLISALGMTSTYHDEGTVLIVRLNPVWDSLTTDIAPNNQSSVSI